MMKKIFAVVMIASVLGLLVGGCGSSDSGSTPPAKDGAAKDAAPKDAKGS